MKIDTREVINISEVNAKLETLITEGNELNQKIEAFINTIRHLVRLLFPVISTERSEWRDLINAPFGASGKPQRYLDYARYDREGGLG